MTDPLKSDPNPLDLVTDLARNALQSWPAIVGEPQLVMHRENTVFRVETECGQAALRIHRVGYHTVEAIKSELDWMAHLAANAIKVPAPIETKTGALMETIGIGEELRIVDLLTWLDGETMGQTGKPLARTLPELQEIFHNLGSEMARLHVISDRWKRPSDFVRHAWDRNGLVGENPFWGSFWTLSDTTAEETALLAATRDRVRRDLDNFISGGADYGLIHADLVRENVLVSGTMIRMIDFDDSGFGFRMFDIATALIKNRNEPHYEAINCALIEGYCTQRQLPQHELDSLPLFMLLRALTYVGWAEARKFEPGMDARRVRLKTEALELARSYLAAG